MKHATALSIGSAMQIAYAYGGKQPYTLGKSDYTYQRRVAGPRYQPPAHATAIIVIGAESYVVRPVVRGKVLPVSVVITLAGDALRDLI
jgi:hypothetical protein